MVCDSGVTLGPENPSRFQSLGFRHLVPCLFSLASQRCFLHVHLLSTFEGGLASSSVLLRVQSSCFSLFPLPILLLAASPQLCTPSFLVNRPLPLDFWKSSARTQLLVFSSQAYIDQMIRSIGEDGQESEHNRRRADKLKKAMETARNEMEKAVHKASLRDDVTWPDIMSVGPS